MGRVQEAIIHFREAIRLAPCRLDCYEGKMKNRDEQCESVGNVALALLIFVFFERESTCAHDLCVEEAEGDREL